MTFLTAVLSSGSSNSSLSDVEPGVLGFLVVAGIGVVLVFLLRSMNKQFRKLGPPPEDQEDPQEAEEGTSDAPNAKAEGAKRG